MTYTEMNEAAAVIQNIYKTEILKYFCYVTQMNMLVDVKGYIELLIIQKLVGIIKYCVDRYFILPYRQLLSLCLFI